MLLLPADEKQVIMILHVCLKKKAITEYTSRTDLIFGLDSRWLPWLSNVIIHKNCYNSVNFTKLKFKVVGAESHPQHAFCALTKYKILAYLMR